MSKKKSHSNESTTDIEEKDEWRTNKTLFSILDREFKFNTDIAATKDNALCKRFFTKEDSALDPEKDWLLLNGTYPTAFCNPPFSLFYQFLQRGNQEIRKAGTGAIVFVVRGDSPEVRWFRDNLINPADGLPYHEIRHYFPRVRFLNPQGEEKKNIGFPTAVVVMRPNRVTKVIWKPWREKDLQIPFEFMRAQAYQNTRFSDGGI